MTTSADPLANKGVALRDALLKLEGGYLRGNFYLSEPCPVKVKHRDAKSEETVWLPLKVTAVCTNCMLTQTVSIPWWSVLDWKLV